MKTVTKFLAPFLLAIGALPFRAQADLTEPVTVVNQPIEMSYRDLDATGITGNVIITLFKQGQQVRTQSQSFKGTISSRSAGKDLELLMKGEVSPGQIRQVLCLMRRTGEVLKCTPETRVTFPLYDRQTYKSGDPMTMPLVQIGGVTRALNGKVRGTSIIDHRQVLVVDFADRRAEKTGAIDIAWNVAGHAYMDIATGYPVELEASAEMSGAFSPDFDRVQMYTKQAYTLPSIKN